MIKNYWVEYISQNLEGASAKEEPSHPGWYRYRKLFTGANEHEVAADVIAFGGKPFSINVAKQRHPYFDSISREYKEEFLQAIIYNLDSGMSAGKAFLVVTESELGSVRTKLEMGARVLNRGGGFCDAMRSTGFFDEATLAILEAGERTGTMRAALAAAIEHYASWTKSMKVLIGAVIILAVDFVGAIAAVSSNKYGFLPFMAKEGIQTEDPLKKIQFSERVEVATFLNDLMFWPSIAFTLLVVIAIVFYVSDDPEPRKWIEKKLNKVTYLGEALRHNALSTTTKVLSSLLVGGVQLLPAIAIASKGTRNEEIKEYWRNVIRDIEKGDGVARAIQSGMLDSTESIALAAHTNQKQLALILGRIADRRQEKGRLGMKKFLWLSGGISVVFNVLAILISGYVWVLQNATISG